MDREIINNIKSLGLDMINNANSGHPGIVLGAAPIIYTLYANHLNVVPSDPNWMNRDRFVLSAGHGSALLYATLFMAGYDLSIEDLKNFRKIDSKTPGHPEVKVTPGVDMSTGPLGQGIASSVGISLASKIYNERYKLPKKDKKGKFSSLFDYYTYVLCGDGDLMEGVSYEALSLAGSLKLNNLIILYDSNRISLDGKTTGVFDENVLKRFEAIDFNTILVKDGNNVASIDKAINEAKKSLKPTIIEIRTTIGLNSINEGTNLVHGSPLKEEDYQKTKVKLGLKNNFEVNEKAMLAFRKKIMDRCDKKYELWKKEVTINNFIFPNMTLNLDILNLDLDNKKSLREINGLVMQEISRQIPNFIGGSADVASSTKTLLKNDITTTNYNNKNIKFGVREHAMGAILNGLALNNFMPFGSTFLAFADYLKPSIRMSAIMDLPVTYVFTHDSIDVGQDGPTHQPIEQINMLRSIPKFYVFRPADYNEIIGSWQYMINHRLPSALILSRNAVDEVNSSISLIEKGGYIVRKEVSKIHGIIIATGSEVALASKLANDLYKSENLDIRVVSMPCRELFLLQDEEYKKEVLEPMSKKIVLEFGNKYGWEGFVYNSKYLLTIDQFGYSGSKDEVLTKLNLDYESIKNKIKSLLK